MSGIQQMLTGGTYAPAAPTTIGQAYGGGYYAGKIAVGGGGVATHYLIVAPKATGETYANWGIYGVLTTATSVIDGPSNTTNLAARGAAYAAATFCENLTTGGYSDWYLPAKNELEVLYYFLKPTTQSNYPLSGSNANAVSPEPISTNYTSGSPAQSSATSFQSGGGEAFIGDRYWSSSDFSSIFPWRQRFTDGVQSTNDVKDSALYVRAVRRVPV
jgi:hypothetical protein